MNHAEDSLSEFHRTLRESAIWPFWEVCDDVMMSEPCAPDAPRIWRWKDLLPFIDRAGRGGLDGKTPSAARLCW